MIVIIHRILSNPSSKLRHTRVRHETTKRFFRKNRLTYGSRFVILFLFFLTTTSFNGQARRLNCTCSQLGGIGIYESDLNCKPTLFLLFSSLLISFKKANNVITSLLDVKNTFELELEIKKELWTVFNFVSEKLPMTVPVFIK